MATREFADEKFWLAGCLRSKGDGFEWRGIEQFAPTSPARDSEDICASMFDPPVEFCDVLMESNTDLYGYNKYPNIQDTASDCMASCVVNEECKAFVWVLGTKRCKHKENVRTSLGRNGKKTRRGYVSGVVPDCFDRTRFTTRAPPTTTTTTTTTLPPPPPPKIIEVTVRDAETNELVEHSEVEATLLTDPSYSEMTWTNSQGIAKIFVTETGKYRITATKRDYIVGTGRVLMRAQDGYTGKATVTTSRILPAGTLRMIMNWQESPLDMALHAFQVNNEDKNTCQTYYMNMNSCTPVKQDLDNR